MVVSIVVMSVMVFRRIGFDRAAVGFYLETFLLRRILFGRVVGVYRPIRVGMGIMVMFRVVFVAVRALIT